ncbi:GAF domain-containing protein [Aureibaculum sp. A20]|uniref:histidine kinase n=1 Tax=Aureibaculum flavum TaxID=2795986 RepID=A0ABS0WU93_9FLAO|nr:two-component regulator propeller domain-containing protein [Aureibaculum flavum]MBJ2175564.1 GAF domain-containing protein [Aureibaculum flavum]
MKTNQSIQKRSLVLLILGLFLVTFLFPTKLLAQQIDPDYISIGDGLAVPNVKDVFQDSFGLIWIATSNGLQKYDGYTFTTFKNVLGKTTSLANNSLWSIAEDDEHNLWIGTDAGVSKFNRDKKTFTNYDFTTLFNLPPGISAVFNIYIDSQKTIWAASRSAELVFYDKENDTWKPADYNIPNSSEGTVTNNAVFAITDDANGGLWFGSFTHGLMHRAKNATKFDPVSFEDTETVDFTSDVNGITALFVDSENIIWITTRNGVYKYDPIKNKLKTLQTYTENQAELWNLLNDIIQDNEGNIWIANNYRGILKFKGISDAFQVIPVNGVYEAKGIGMSVTFSHFIIDKSGIFWMGSINKGILTHNPESKPFIHYTHDQSNEQSISMNGLFGLLSSKVNPNTLYVGTRGEGLNIFNEKNQTFKQVKYKVINDTYGGAVRSIGELSDGTVYLGSWSDGIIELDRNWNEKRRFVYNEKDENSISDDKIRVLKTDAKNNFWVGTSNGLNYFDTKKGTFKRITSSYTQTYPDELLENINNWSTSDKAIAKFLEVTDNQNLSQSFEITKSGTYLIVSIGEGDIGSMADFGSLENTVKDTLWISNNFNNTKYAGGGLKNRIEIQQIELEPGNYELKYRSDDSHSFGVWNEDAPTKTKLYGTILIQLNTADKTLVETLLKKDSDKLVITGSNILSMKLTDDFLWVGTDAGGLNKINLKDNTVKSYLADPNIENAISSNAIFDINLDKKGFVWIATNAGLNKLDPKTETFTHYNESDGLPTNLIESVVIGKNGEMWLSTQNGLSQMVTSKTLGKVTFINYSSEDGLGGDSFLSQVATVTPEGRFYFGGEHGLNAVSKIKTNDVPPNLILSNLLISNQSVYNMGEASPLKKDLLSTDTITMAHNQNNLSFEFAALHYANPKKNQYAHILKGYDNDWIYDNRNYASYTNLDPGDYEFIIRASNAYGVWNEEGKSIFISIKSPWYKTWWAYGIYAILIGSLIFTVHRFQRRKLILKERQRSQIREMELRTEAAESDAKALQAENDRKRNVEMLSEIGKKITSSLDLDDIFHKLYEHVNELADASIFGVGIYHPEKHKIEYRLAMEKGKAYPVYFRDTTDKNQFPVWCIENQKPIFINDVQLEYKNYIEHYKEPETVFNDGTKTEEPTSIIYLPLISKKRVLGVITIQSFEKNAYTDYHLNLLQNLASYTAIALDNADAYTALKATQSQLIQSEKMASLGELTAGIAHEIQNPLNFVNNFSEISNELIDEMNEELDNGDLEEAKNIAKDIKQNLEKINHHGKRADAIVKGMLQHSRSNSGQKEPTDINALADEYLRLAYHGLRAKDKSFNATLKTDFDTSLEKIKVIPQDIGRLILNLITNAFYAVNDRKKQNIQDYEPTVSVSTKKKANTIEILVEDNGNGIPKKIIDKIFQPFFTTKPTGQGTGLGLSMSYDIIKAHGGELKVETKEGIGTKFSIIFTNTTTTSK